MPARTTAESVDDPANANGEADAAVAKVIAAATDEEKRGKKRPKTKVFASWVELETKKSRTDDVLILMKDKDDELIERWVRLEALGAKEYDDLLAAHKPTTKQANEGQTFNIDTFLPALIAATAVNPRLTEDQVEALYKSDDWSGGEIGGLFFRAQRICQGSPDVAFIEAG
jgi:hypothetical protein